MCTISDTIKFCTCKVEDMNILDNYWVLKRFKQNEPMVVGCVVAPEKSIDTEKDNYELLTSILNVGVCFDIDMHFQDQDTLEIYLYHKRNDSSTRYLFSYYNNTWTREWPNPFSSYNQEKIQEGEIRQAFK